MGAENRGSIMFKNYDGNLIVITPNGYAVNYDRLIENDNSRFELWAFIHEMVDEEDMIVRQEAVNRHFDVYCNLYQFIRQFRDCHFITE